MNKHLSEQPISASRRARRSLVEFTLSAIPAAGGIVEPFRPAKLNPSISPRSARPDHAPRLKIADKPKLKPPVRAKKAFDKFQDNAMGAVPQAESKPAAVSTDSDGNKLLDAVGEVAAVAAKAVKDYRVWILDQMKSNMTAGLAYAGGFAGLPPAASADSESEQKNDRGAPGAGQDISPSAKVTAEFCSKAVELMTANVNAAVEFAHRLGDVTSPSEFVALSSSHARKHAELVITHAVALGAYSQELTETSAEQVNTNLAKAFDQKS